jgi:hypothetical protein
MSNEGLLGGGGGGVEVKRTNFYTDITKLKWGKAGYTETLIRVYILCHNTIVIFQFISERISSLSADIVSFT